MPTDELSYSPGLNRMREAVISSHFMHRICVDRTLDVYNSSDFRARSLFVDSNLIADAILPRLLQASEEFARRRSAVAKSRAGEYHRDYGLDSPSKLRVEHFICEAIFDKNFSRSSNKYVSRALLSAKIAKLVELGRPIGMVIPALPFKISSPLKTRGLLPDFGEVNFILQLYEICRTVEILYGEFRGSTADPLAHFVVVSDGSRFEDLIGEPKNVVRDYQRKLKLWISLLGIADHVKIVDYKQALEEQLSATLLESKEHHRQLAIQSYSKAMWPIFDAENFNDSLALAAQVEIDPEIENPEGRFASLLKSMVYTLRFSSLDQRGSAPSALRDKQYRELTAKLFEGFGSFQTNSEFILASKPDLSHPLTAAQKEHLRRAMLRELWDATILYLAEIKSDRELAQEPISLCFPDHIRWTIHAKPGQIAIATPSAGGHYVQPWAGAAVFKGAKGAKIKLCTLPVLALEGSDAVPVRMATDRNALELADQPVFYIHPDANCATVDDLLDRLSTSIERRRAS